MIANERFVWIDMETTGLEPNKNVPLELGFIITDIELNEIDRASWVIYEKDWEVNGKYDAYSMDPFVQEMHTKSGLWQAIPKEGVPLQEVQVDAWKWLTQNGIGTGSGQPEDPMCGSSVQFDREWAREWFPDIFDRFSYRNIDISTLKELMRRLSPDIYATMSESEYCQKREMHRVLPDLEDTISEFKFYRQEFLYVPADFA